MTVDVEREFFHGQPAEAVRRLRAGGRREPAERWLLGAALGALGRYGEAKDLLVAVADAEPAGRYRSLAASTLASHYRQLGRHAEARGWDERAAATAGHDPDARFDAALGLAADAVGAGDLAAAQAGLIAAAGLLPAAAWPHSGRIGAPGTSIGPQPWRRQVRYGWVVTEIALLGGDPSAAVQVARTGLAVAREAAAPRHVAKCLLFLGASEHVDARDRPDEQGLAVRASATLREASAAAAAVGAVPLRWVAEALLAEQAAAGGDADQARRHQRAAADAIEAIASGLRGDDRRRWLRQPDIVAIAGVSR